MNSICDRRDRTSLVGVSDLRLTMPLVSAIILIMSLLMSYSAFASESDDNEKLRFAPHEAIVKFRQVPRATEGLQLERDLRNDVFVVKDHASGVRRGDLNIQTLDYIAELRRRPDVEYAHPNYYLSLAQVSTNDTYFPAQWPIHQSRIDRAWMTTTGSSGIRVAVVDSGRSLHPELSSRWTLAYNAANPGGPVGELLPYSHGTHVASILGAVANNNAGIAGVCWSCGLLSAKVVDASNNIEIEYIIDALYWSIDNGADVVNISLAQDGLSCDDVESLQDAFDDAYNAGVSVVVAAGNFGGSVGNVTPASCSNVVTVAASTPSGTLRYDSGRGVGVTLTAPGGDGDPYGMAVDCPHDPDGYYTPNTTGVLAAWTTTVSGGAQNCYRYMSGTSMAAPHVAGTIGLMLSVNPSLSPSEVTEILVASAMLMPACGGNCGAGLLDANRAVKIAENPMLLNAGKIAPIIGLLLE